jgi:hypothetical protein
VPRGRRDHGTGGDQHEADQKGSNDPHRRHVGVMTGVRDPQP